MPKKNLDIAILDFDDIKNPLLGAGGAWTTYELGRRLAKKGHRITVYCSRFPKSKDRKENGITYRHIGLGSANIKLNNAAYFFAIPFALMSVRADIVLECFTAPISVLLGPLWTNIPVVVLPNMFAGKEFAKKYKLPFHWIEKFGVRFYKYILPYSSYIEEKVKKLNPKIISKIVPEGVDEKFLHIKQKKAKHILFLGRFDMMQKGIDLLIEAYAKIAGQIKYPLKIVGKGPDKDKIQTLIKSKGLTDKIEVLPAAYGKEKFALLSESIIVTFPSRIETFSLFALEVLAAGLPMIIFDIKPLVWIDKTAVLMANPFDIDKYAKQILSAIEVGENNRLRIKARQFARKFTWDKATEEYESFFYKVLQLENEKK